MADRFQGFVGPSYSLRNSSFDCQRTINFYPEINESGTPGREAEIAQFLPTPGLKSVVSGMKGRSRGGYVTSNNRLFWMFGPTLYEIFVENGEYTTKALDGNFPGFDQVQFTQNEFNLFFVSNGNIFSINLDNELAFKLIDPSNRNASSLTFIDSYIVFSRVGSNQIYWTEPLEPSITSAFATAESNPDEVVAVVSNNLNLWILGTSTAEVWYNQGDPDQPFIRRGTTVIETGCKAARSVAKLENTIAWLAADIRGGVSVVVAEGFTPQRISTHALEHEWNKFTHEQLTGASAFTYKDAGHAFYCLNIPGADSQYVFDFSTGLWHERQSQVDGNLTAFRTNSHVFYNGVHLVGDSNNLDGELHEMSEDYFDENGVNIIRERTTPHISSNGNRLIYRSLTLDVFAGNTLKQDFTPKIMVDWSDDGGKSWSRERHQSVGRVGEYDTRVKLFNLGMARNRVFRIRVSDPIYWSISGASLELGGARH